MSEKILLVDDEEQLLIGLRRNLHEEFDQTCAQTPAEALHSLASEDDFAVIVTDYKLPGMNGVELLQQAKKLRPDTVRMVLTGFADIRVITDAINEGSVFRFLSKPCPASQMRLALQGGQAQFRLIRAEKELLNKTLMGCVKVFGDLISNFDPLLHAQVKNTRAILQILPLFGLSSGIWEAEIAVLLSPLGRLTVPPHIIEKTRANRELTPEEKRILEGVPRSTCRLLGNIPRLEAVIETILHEQEPCSQDVVTAPPRPWMILRACQDLVVLQGQHRSFSAALKIMEETNGVYHPACLIALRAGLDEISKLELTKGTGVFRKSIRDLTLGTRIIDPITTFDGLVIVPGNHELHAADLERIHNFDQSFGLKDSIFCETM